MIYAMIDLGKYAAYLLILPALFLITCSRTPVAPPNIVFILADDLGWADLPMYGNRFHETPNLQKLADQGKLFTNAYAACPVCSPTRASIQSGQYPARLGIIDFLPGHWRPYERLTVATNRTQYMPLEIETLGELCQRAGYATGYFGKWHLGYQEEYFPKHQGYDESIIFHGSPYYNYGRVLQPNQEVASDKILSEYLTDVSIDFLEKNQDTSFFLFLAHYDVHVQLNADSQLIEKYLAKPKVPDYPCNAVYAAMVEHIDHSVGRIMASLDSLGLAENTLVVFFSDNGGLVSRFDEKALIHPSKQHLYQQDSLLLHVASSNAPLRSEKGTVFEGGIREPLIVRWPANINAGTQTASLVTSVDFFPTIADLLELDPPKQMLDGRSIRDVLMDEPERSNEPRAIFWHYPVYHHDVPASAVRQGKWKLIHFLDDNHHELYDLEADIGETNDLASQHTDKAAELMARLEQWRTSVSADMPTVNPDFDPLRRREWGRHPDSRRR